MAFTWEMVDWGFGSTPTLSKQRWCKRPRTTGVWNDGSLHDCHQEWMAITTTLPPTRWRMMFHTSCSLVDICIHYGWFLWVYGCGRECSLFCGNAIRLPHKHILFEPHSTDCFWLSRGHHHHHHHNSIFFLGFCFPFSRKDLTTGGQCSGPDATTYPWSLDSTGHQEADHGGTLSLYQSMKFKGMTIWATIPLEDAWKQRGWTVQFNSPICVEELASQAYVVSY